MWANIGKSTLLTFIISIGASILSYLGSSLFNKFVELAVGVDLLICLASLVAFVWLAKLWLTRQRSRFLDLLSVGVVPVLTGFPVNSISSPPYRPTLTLYNAYLAPLENVARYFSTSILGNHFMLVLEVLVPPLLMWSGLILKRTSILPNHRAGKGSEN